MIHSNTFTKNSGYLTTNAIRIDIQTSLGYDTAITTTMPCAGVQISSNTFSQNIGCKNTGGVLQASCYSESEMTALESEATSYTEPSPMSKTSSENIQKTSVASFSTVNSVSLNEGSTSMDLNKFMMKDNTYTENYPGKYTDITTYRYAECYQLFQ